MKPMENFDVVVQYRQCIEHKGTGCVCGMRCRVPDPILIEMKDITVEMAKAIKREQNLYCYRDLNHLNPPTFIDSDGLIKKIRLKRKDHNTENQRVIDFLDSVIAKPLYDVDGDKYNDSLQK